MLMPIASTVEDWTEDDGGKRALVKSGDDLHLATCSGRRHARSRETRLGFVLAEHKDRVFGEWRIVEADRDPAQQKPHVEGYAGTPHIR